MPEMFSVKRKALSSMDLRLQSQRKANQPYTRPVKSINSHSELETVIKMYGTSRTADSKSSDPCCETTSSITTGSSSQCPGAAPSAQSLLDGARGPHICDTSEEMLELFTFNRKALSSMDLVFQVDKKTSLPYARPVKRKECSLEKAFKTCLDEMARTDDIKSSEPETKSSITTGPSSQCPGAAPSARPLLYAPRRHHMCEESKQRRVERWGMLLPKRPLRVQSLHYSRRTENELDRVSTSQQYFKLDVPKWSDYFPPPSGEKKMTSPVDPSSTSEVKPVAAHKSGLEKNNCSIPAPVIVSDRCSPIVDLPVGMPVIRNLVIGDSTLKRVQVESPGTMVNCIRGARASDIKSKLNVLAKAERRFDRIIVQLGINEVQLRHSETSKTNIKEVCDLAKTMSDTVICSGPIPSYWGDELYSRLSDLHDWMCEWCPHNNLGFIDNWKHYCMRPDLFWGDGLYPNSDGTAILSKNLTDSLNSADVYL